MKSVPGAKLELDAPAGVVRPSAQAQVSAAALHIPWQPPMQRSQLWTLPGWAIALMH